MTEYYKLEGDTYYSCEESDANHIMIPIEEYHGLQKVLRIMKERGLQQIKKSDFDENGYQMLKASIVNYPGTKIKVYLIEKRVAYSIDIPINEKTIMITQDLRNLYNLPDWRNLQINKTEFLRDLEDYKNKKNMDLINNESLELIKKYKGRINLGIKDVRWNYAQGMFEISYHATAIF